MSARKRTWTQFRRTAYSEGTVDARRPVALFDFDSTLHPYRGSGPEEELTLCFLAGLACTFNVAIISNRPQSGKDALAALKQYVAKLDERTADVAVTVYAPGARDRERKPHTGTWEHYVARLGARPSFAFYCGDAAGRPGDHSAGDYMFALNIGVEFTTPEQIFGPGSDIWAPPETVGCDASPPRLLAGPPETSGAAPDAWMAAVNEQPKKCVVILIGSPASGKTRVAAALVQKFGFVSVNADKQGARCRNIFVDAVASGRSVVVDNTNPTAAERSTYAGHVGGPAARVLFFHVSTPKAVCFHLNAARCQLDATGATFELPPVAIHAYWKRLEPPTEKEAAALGARLVEIPFVLSADAPDAVRKFRYPLR